MEFPAGCLGKLPLHGDFIRLNAAGPEVNELDQWIQEGIYQGYNELGSGWDRSFDSAPPAAFIYRSARSNRILAGLFKPSVDRAGRRYPFLLYAVLDAAGFGADVGYLPNALAPFSAQAGELLAHAGRVGTLKGLLESVEGLRFMPDITEARKAFGRFVLTITAGDYWSAIFDGHDDPRRYAAIGSAVEGSGIRGGGNLAMRLPFNGQDSEPAFWLELSRRLTDGKGLPTLMLWNQAWGGEEGAATTPARLHVAWGELSARYYLPFVMPTRASLGIRDLTSAHALDGRWVEYGKARFDEVLSNPSLKLTDLLQRLPRS